jgi:hypothetical protein
MILAESPSPKIRLYVFLSPIHHLERPHSIIFETHYDLFLFIFFLQTRPSCRVQNPLSKLQQNGIPLDMVYFCLEIRIFAK